MKKLRTDYIFPTTSFSMGVGSVMGTFYPYYHLDESLFANDADYKAIYSDFGSIGEDIVGAMEETGIDNE